MNQTPSGPTRAVIIVRWIARIAGILSTAMFLVLFVADCVKKGSIAIGDDRILMTAFMLLAFIGLGIAWKREGIGGATALVGLVGFTVFAPASLPGGGSPCNCGAVRIANIALSVLLVANQKET